MWTLHYNSGFKNSGSLWLHNLNGPCFVLNSLKWSLHFQVCHFNLARWYYKRGVDKLPSSGFRKDVKVVTGKSSQHEDKLQTRVWTNHYGFKTILQQTRETVSMWQSCTSFQAFTNRFLILLFPWQHLTFHVCFSRKERWKLLFVLNWIFLLPLTYFIHRLLVEMAISHSFQKFNAIFLL